MYTSQLAATYNQQWSKFLQWHAIQKEDYQLRRNVLLEKRDSRPEGQRRPKEIDKQLEDLSTKFLEASREYWLQRLHRHNLSASVWAQDYMTQEDREVLNVTLNWTRTAMKDSELGRLRRLRTSVTAKMHGDQDRPVHRSEGYWLSVSVADQRAHTRSRVNEPETKYDRVPIYTLSDKEVKLGAPSLDRPKSSRQQVKPIPCDSSPGTQKSLPTFIDRLDEMHALIRNEVTTSHELKESADRKIQKLCDDISNLAKAYMKDTSEEAKHKFHKTMTQLSTDMFGEWRREDVYARSKLVAQDASILFPGQTRPIYPREFRDVGVQWDANNLLAKARSWTHELVDSHSHQETSQRPKRRSTPRSGPSLDRVDEEIQGSKLNIPRASTHLSDTAGSDSRHWGEPTWNNRKDASTADGDPWSQTLVRSRSPTNSNAAEGIFQNASTTARPSRRRTRSGDQGLGWYSAKDDNTRKGYEGGWFA